jgi:GNAT superfamily N-acetyltransferase
MVMKFRIRIATRGDIPDLQLLIEESVRELQSKEYTQNQIDEALRTVYGVDTQLIEDGTYFVVEEQDSAMPIACGGWSKRKTLFGGDKFKGREDSLLDPTTDAAKIRAFFVHPNWIRQGIASQILEACERAAIETGFSRLEMGATLTGIPFYKARGYIILESLVAPLSADEVFPLVRMVKQLSV